MKIKMLTSMAGIGFALEPGQEWETDNKQAIRLIEAGFAIPVVESTVETTTLEPVTEKRTARRQPKSGE
jgi:hypothetical protein